MGSPLRMLAALLVGVVVTAAVAPCPPAFQLAGEAASSELSIKAKCPCSCAHGRAPSPAGGHLDFALARPDAGALPRFLMALVLAPLAPAPTAPPALSDPVPI